MNRKVLIPLILLAGCTKLDNSSGPPPEQLYFPMAVSHVDVGTNTEGVLFVANADADKRYPTGSIVAITLDTLGLPTLGADVPAGEAAVKRIEQLNIGPTQMVQIAAFSGEMALHPIGGNKYRMYVPTRSEGNYMYQTLAEIDATGVPTLSCLGEGGVGQNCAPSGISLTPTKFGGYDAGVQWPLTPYGVAAATRSCVADQDCCAEGVDLETCGRKCSSNQCLQANGEPFADVWVGYAPRADYLSLIGSNNPLIGHLARLDSDDFRLKDDSLIPIGFGGVNSLALAGPWVYVSGRILAPAPNLLRLVNREDSVVLSSSLESFFRVSDSRSLALSSDGKRLFVVGRVPDTLLIVNIDSSSGAPALTFLRGIALPDAPNDVKVIPRPGQGDLVAVSCTAAGSVVFYDDDVGDLVSYVGGIGLQPFGIAVDVRGNAARLFVTLHGDGRIAVIDVPDLNRPQAARLVAHLGKQQLCLTRGSTSPGCVASQEPTP